MRDKNQHIVLFKTDDGKVSVDARFDEETVWLSLDQIAVLFGRNKSTISRHIRNIFEEGELSVNSVVANFATTASDGKTYQVDFYNLDVIISVGYRVKSDRGTEFRIWATKRLNEYIRKGFAMDDERLNSQKPFVGMTNFKGDYVTKSDVTIAKNYLSDKELMTLNLLVSQYLDFAELQALEERAMTMKEWIDTLDRILAGNGRELLADAGKISHREAVEKAEREFEIYRAKEMRELQSDFDRMIKELEVIQKGGVK